MDFNWISDKVPLILTIDDDDLVRQSILMYLEDCGFDTIEARTGQEGIELYQQNRPDLVLCDLRMPGVDGMQVLDVITKEQSQVPVIMISGAGMIHDVVEALRLGAHDYLVKPITDLNVLGHAVKQALSKIQLEHENLLYRKELEKANTELHGHLNVLQQDQEAGRRAQLQLLPPPSGSFGDFHFNHTVIPSLNLSGDYLDYFEIDERYIGFYLADVSGHGSASAFVTMMLKSLFNQPIRNYRTNNDLTILHPEQVLSYLNVEVLNANIGKHVTLFYGVIDRESNCLTYCVGGQFPRPMICTKNSKYIIEQRGLPIGLFDWATYDSNKINIEAPFSMVMFSDGVLECLQAHGKSATEEDLLTIKFDLNTDVNNLIQQFGVRELDKLPDDVSILMLRRL